MSRCELCRIKQAEINSLEDQLERERAENNRLRMLLNESVASAIESLQTPKEALSVRETSDRLGISENAVRALLINGKLEGMKGEGHTGRWLVTPAAIKEYIKERINNKGVGDAKSQKALTDRSKRPSSARSKHREVFNFPPGGESK